MELGERRYDQPFWVGRQNQARFPTARNGYLPALESKEIERTDEEEPWGRKQWDIVNQLRLEQINIRNLIYKTLKENKAKYASKRKTNRYNKYT